MSSDNVLVIPATFMVGRSFPANLPLADGSVKPITQCSKSDVEQAVVEIRAMAEASRNRLRQAYEEHLEVLEMLAQVSAYLDRYEHWEGVRQGEGVREVIWSVDKSRTDQQSSSG